MKIKFMAWDKENRKMIYANPFESFQPGLTFEGNCYKHGKLQNWILRQFTGRHDSKSEEIYDSDVVRLLGMWETVDCIVKWHDKLAQWRLDPLPKHKPRYVDYAWDLDRPFTKIGNIYENPELLEE